jgi:ATP-dependent DNA helicase RecG
MAAEIRLVDPEPDVVRELVANAFAHRDWEQPGVIEIGHSPDALVVSSPGDLLPTLHPDRLLRESAQRNRVLSREITRLRIAEGAGMGFDRVYRALAAAGKDVPRIEPGPRFTVIVPGGRGDRAFARYLRGPDFPEPRLAADLDVLLTLATLRRRSSLTAATVAPIVQREEEFAEEVLRRMHGAGLLEPTRSTASRRRPSYRLSPATSAALRPALSYRVGTIDVDDAKLLRHLARHRRIANEDVRNYLDCDVPTARNRLSRLRAKGFIDFAPSGPKRGPRVEYVATDKIDVLDL